MVATNSSPQTSAPNPSAPSSAIERKIRRLGQDVLRMGAMVETSFRYSQDVLFRRELSAVTAIAELEKQIDEYYRQIEADCVLTMTLNAPVAEDCRWLSALMQLIRDLERIGDYAEDLAEIGVRLFAYPVPELLPEIESMARDTQMMLAMSLSALVTPNPDAGEQLKAQDNSVDDAYDELYGKLAGQQNVPGAVEPTVLMVLAIRHLERMADHATNIAQRTSYIVTGQRG
ncbi:MAG: phosphate signaling complex protein PhoU [Cyanobacteria bacterium P01_C01_bin.89]